MLWKRVTNGSRYVRYLATIRNALSGDPPQLQAATLERFARKPVAPKTLKTLAFPDLSKASLFASANYARDELPVRLAHRLVDMRKLPYFVLTTPSLQRVYQFYIEAFTSFAKFPPITSMEQELAFTELLEHVVSESVEVLDLVARGLQEVRRLAQCFGDNVDELLHHQLQAWVDDLMTSRIGRRVLGEQHIALHEAVCRSRDAEKGDSDGETRRKNGVVDMRCDVVACLDQSIRAAKRVSLHQYGITPEVTISGCKTVHLPFVHAHMEYILFELLKNAMRATVEHAGGTRERTLRVNGELPAVHVFMAEGPTELTIRISDAGGGLKRSELDKVFEYGYTTVGENAEDDEIEAVSGQSLLGSALSDRGMAARDSPMAGLGFGLPMSRVYARYFGGDTKVVNLEGYGCDIYVTLSRTGDVLENIIV